MLYSALLRVSSTMGDCPSGNPPLCLHIMFVLYYCFCYWRNKYSSSTTEILQQFDVASTVMSRMTNVWRQKKFSRTSKMCLCNVCYVCCLCALIWMWDTGSWTILKVGGRKLEASHISCHPMRPFALSVCVTARMGQASLCSQISISELFRLICHHVWRRIIIHGYRDGWRYPRGRPRHTWIRQLETDP